MVIPYKMIVHRDRYNLLELARIEVFTYIDADFNANSKSEIRFNIIILPKRLSKILYLI
jgi:hypothetical protein